MPSQARSIWAPLVVYVPPPPVIVLPTGVVKVIRTCPWRLTCPCILASDWVSPLSAATILATERPVKPPSATAPIDHKV